jgi:hypothetical protein
MPEFPEINDKDREISKKARKRSLDEKQRKQRQDQHDGEHYDEKQLVDAQYIKNK